MFHVEQFLLKWGNVPRGTFWLGGMRVAELCQAGFLQVSDVARSVFAGNCGCLCIGQRVGGNLYLLRYVPHAMAMGKR